MPTLNWIGKEKIVNHHNDVVFRTLEKKYSYGEENSGNMIIHGDNLEALKALLPKYEGRIKCIYIDPPYNTGNENWVYNDNVNDPRIKKWLGEVVGKESDDLSRHDKWLCMMYPRLVLLQRLLSEDGAIFISIDDNEQANLKLICDEIFGSLNFVACVSWQRTYSTRNDSKGIPKEVESIIIYSKKPMWSPKKLERTEKMNAIYKSPDNDPSPWTSSSVSAPGAATHQGMVYAIQHPFTGELLYPTIGRCWSLGQDSMMQHLSKWANYKLQDIHDEIKRAEICGISKEEIKQEVPAIVLTDSVEVSRNNAKKVLTKGNWPYFYFTNGGEGGLRRKTYLENMEGRVVTNYFPCSETGHTDEAKKEIISIFEGKSPFDTPKPTRLIERVLKIATNENSIILDSFAGSGTTAHAVSKLNKQDGGNRKFILCEMCDYAEDITAERVRRVMKGYGEGKNKVEGTGGGFDFYELGDTIFDSKSGLLNDNAPLENIREYVWFTETNIPYNKPEDDRNEYLLGRKDEVDYYLYYKQGEETTLNWDFLRSIRRKAEQYIIYADRCLLDAEEMQKHNIVYKKIPRDIKRV